MANVTPATLTNTAPTSGKIPHAIPETEIPMLGAVDGVVMAESIAATKSPNSVKKLGAAMLMARSEQIADQYHTDNLQAAAAMLSGEAKELILRVLKQRSQGKVLRISHTSRLARR